MPLRCRSSDHTVASAAAADFSVVVDAALVQVPGGGGGGVLAGVFEQDVLGGVASSALCVYKMADVRRRFTDNIRRCFAGQQSYAGLQFGNRVCVALVSLQAALLQTLHCCCCSVHHRSHCPYCASAQPLQPTGVHERRRRTPDHPLMPDASCLNVRSKSRHESA